jgi:elongation factor G
LLGRGGTYLSPDQPKKELRVPMGAPAKKFVPIVEISIGPLDSADRPKLLSALSELSAEDPQFRFAAFGQESHPQFRLTVFGAESHMTLGQENHVILAGTGEIQLDRKIDALRNTYGIGVRLGAPQIAYRETIMRRGEVDYRHKKQMSGHGEFARVKIALDQPGPDSEYACLIRVAVSSLPAKWISGIRKGLETGLLSGPVAGFPLIGVTATLIDSAYHDTDSSPVAFEIAARTAVREGIRKAGPVMLEPIMKVEVLTPEDCAERIVDDLRLRRGSIKNRNKAAAGVAIEAEVPAANLFGYFNSLRVISNGRANFTAQFERYAPTGPSDDPPFAPAIGMRA